MKIPTPKEVRYCIKQVKSVRQPAGKYLASLSIIGDKMACAFGTEDEAVNLKDKKVAHLIADLCDAGGQRTFVYPFKP